MNSTTSDPRATLPDYATALARVLDAVPRGPSIELPLGDAPGHVLHRAITADRPLPPFDRSAMDGYAVRAAEVADGTRLPVAADLAAGQPAPAPGSVPAGACVKIATGAPVPADLDAVVPHERTDRGDPVRFEGPPPAAGDNVHPCGADAAAGDPLVAVGRRVGPAAIALAATTGCTTLTVAPRPAVAVLTTGSELRDVADAVEPHQIRDSNGPMLAALVPRLGGTCVRVDRAIDDPDATEQAEADAIAAADVVLTVGGISAGERDHVADALAARGARTVLRGAAIQPGKPITVSCVARDGRDDAVVISLPGNPVSALACACLFAGPVLAKWSGASADPPFRPLVLAEPVRPNRRRQAFRPARWTPEGIVVPSWQGSGDLAHVAETDGLAALPVQADPLAAGTMVDFLPWP